VPRYSETTYEVHWLDGSNDPQYFDGATAKDMAIRTAREAKANGDEVEVIKSVATWVDEAAAGSLAPIDTKESVVRFSHTITLPKGKRRLNIDEATAALAQMGYRLGNVRYDPAAGGSVYKVTQPNGSVVDMPAAKLTDFIYQKAQHMKNGTKSVNQRLSRMVIGELNHALEMAVGDGEQEIARELRAVIANPTIETLKAHPLAVKEIRFKLGIAQDERMGSRVKAYTELLKSVSNRHGGKARMSQISQMLDTLESQANDQPDLAKKNIQKMVDHVAHEGTRDEFMRLVKIADRLGLRGLMSRTGAKAKFGPAEIEAVSKRMRGIRAKINAAEQALRDEEKQGNFRNGASTCDAIANLYKEMKSVYLAYEAAFRSSRKGARTRFEKSDDYARILMQPVTAANCGKMQKVAADAMKHAKSVGDDDLFELAEEIANTCRTKNPNRGAK
jgi:hypothetical protein